MEAREEPQLADSERSNSESPADQITDGFEDPVDDGSMAQKLDTLLTMQNGDENYEMPDDHALACPARVAAFSLTSKQWGLFLVDRVCDIIWKKDILDRLEIPPETKSTIRALLAVRGRSLEDAAASVNHSFQDVVPNKGMGLAFLFSGPPGTGKTLTVGESVLIPLP